MFNLLCMFVCAQVYTLGTILSMQISFVGFQPVQSSEHMAVSVCGWRGGEGRCLILSRPVSVLVI